MVEEKKICPMSFIFNMGAIAPGTLHPAPHLFAMCANEKCKWWIRGFNEDKEQVDDCAIVVIVRKVANLL